MADFHALFKESKREIDILIDETFWRLLEPTTAIDRLFTTTSYVSRDLVKAKMKRHKPTISRILAPGQEIPANKPKMQLDINQYSWLVTGKSYVWTTEDYQLLEQMENRFAAGGAANSQIATELRRHFFAVGLDQIAGIMDLVKKIQFDLALTAASTWTDAITGAVVNLSFVAELANQSLQYPTALAGNARWNQAATCTPLTNLENHARTGQYDLLGMWPKYLVMPEKVLRYVADANDTKLAAMKKAGMDGTDTTGMYISDEQARSLIAERIRTTPENIIIFDAMYSEDNANDTITDKYFLDVNGSQDYYFFGYDNLIEGAFVPTVERGGPGIAQITELVQQLPRKERTASLANMVPMVRDARYLAARRVV